MRAYGSWVQWWGGPGGAPVWSGLSSKGNRMALLRLGISLQPRWPLDDGAGVLRAARHAEELGFDHVAVGNRVLDSGFGPDTDPLVLLAAVAGPRRVCGW